MLNHIEGIFPMLIRQIALRLSSVTGEIMRIQVGYIYIYIKGRKVSTLICLINDVTVSKMSVK